MKNLILISALLSVFSVSAVASDLPLCPIDTTKRYHNCYGAFIWDDGNKYVGEFKDNKSHGQGTYTWANGEKYVGEFKDNKRHGQGTYTWANGRVRAGVWENGKLVQSYEDTEIYLNCVIDLMPPQANTTLEKAISKKCMNISLNPSASEKQKYSD